MPAQRVDPKESKSSRHRGYGLHPAFDRDGMPVGDCLVAWPHLVNGSLLQWQAYLVRPHNPCVNRCLPIGSILANQVSTPRTLLTLSRAVPRSRTLTDTEEVTGSNPVSPTNNTPGQMTITAVVFDSDI